MRKTIALMNVCGWLALGATTLSSYGCKIEASTEQKEVEPYTPPEAIEAVPGVSYGERRIVILHTNDEHSHLLGAAPATAYPFLPDADGEIDPEDVLTKIKLAPDDLTEGGIVRRQFLINKIRAESTDPVLLVSSGDNMMGTLFHAAFAQASPDYTAMAMLGYDFTTLGNHELDFGPDKLAAAIHAAQVMTFGGAVPIISTNIHFDDVDVEHEGPGSALAAVYGDGGSGAPIVPWAVKVLPNGLKVGVIGMMGYQAALFAAVKGKVAFSVPGDGAACDAENPCATPGQSCTLGHCVSPLDATKHIMAIAADVQPVITMLREDEGVDVVIALSHLGTAEETAVAPFLPGLDVIIGGHSHEEIAPITIDHEVDGEVVSQTFIVQAGAYGRKLGQLTVVVDEDGVVSVDEEATMLHPLDGTLDEEILGETDLRVDPLVIADSFERALGVTQALIGPVLGGSGGQPGLNDLIGTPLFASPTFNGSPLQANPDVVAGAIHSDHDIVGEAPFSDSHLIHLVTDADRMSVVAAYGLDAVNNYVVAVEANGVLRESLRFDANHASSAADVFQVLPLGASPLERSDLAAPGYPLVLFRLAGRDLFAGADIGVTMGLEADDFFLSYAGLKVTYDESLPAYDLATFDPTSTEPQGRVVKIEIQKGNTMEVLFERTAGKTWLESWKNGFDPNPGLNPLTGAGLTTPGDTVYVITNLYLGGYLSAFGITMLGTNGQPLAPAAALVPYGMGVLGQTVLCRDGLQLKLCYDGAAAHPVPWSLAEAKEWQVLWGFLTSPAPHGLGGDIPDDLYEGDLVSRVVPVEE